MRLKSLEIQGFKTFTDKTKIEFIDGISAVVGPNGSGKSNISDAIKWALGEQSVRDLRCSKLEDIIFAGSVTRKAQNCASVKLTFDNKDRDMKDLDEEISVLRRYFRNGESEYFINMKPVRLKDINELFMDTGLGKYGYSMIGQGKIDMIVKAKPSERRQIFEEAAGISGCRYKKEDAEQRLKKADENLLRVKDILLELEARVGPLKKQCENAKLYLEYVEKKKRLEISLWVKEIDGCKANLENKKENLNYLKKEKETLDEDLLRLEKDIEENSNGVKTYLAKTDELRRTLLETEKEISNSKSQVVILNNNIENNRQTITGTENENLENIKRLELLKEDISTKQNLYNEKKKFIIQKQKELDDDINILNDNKIKLSDYENERNNIKKDLERLQQGKNDKNIKIASIQYGIKEAENRNKEIKNLISEKENILKKSKENYRIKKLELNKLSEEIDKISDEQASFNEIFIEHKKNYEKAQKEIQTLKLDIESETRKIKFLEELEHNMEGLSRGVKAIVIRAKEGELSGVVGTVSEIISADKVYAIAIDIALGAYVQNIITKNEEAAKTAIEFLKKEKLGRATFLPLTAIKGNKAKIESNFLGEGFIGIASDLCLCEEKYLNIKEYLLGRTLIAKDIDSAINISKNLLGKFKVVTLDGQVVNAGGSLTGGFVSNKSGLIGRASEIKQLKNKKEELNKSIKLKELVLQKLSDTIMEKEKIIKLKKEKIEILKNQKNLIISEINKLISEQALYESSIKELKREENIKAEKKAKLLEEIKDFQIDIEKTESEINEIKIKLKEAQEKNLKILKESDSNNLKVQEANLSILKMEKELGILEVEILSLKSKEEEKLESNKKMLLNINDLKISNGEYEKEIIKTNEKVKNLEEQKENIHIELVKCRDKRENLEKISVELRKEEREKARGNELLIKEISKIEENQKTAQKNYDGIIANLWDEYEITLGEARESLKRKGETEKYNGENEKREEKEEKKELSEVKLKIKNLGQVNLSSIKEYTEVNERYLLLKNQFDDIESSKKKLISIINGLNKDMKGMFLSKFNEINKNFAIIIKELFGGGSGKLILEDLENVLSCGINISVNIPGKKEINLEALSGGEKALVAISLYFAIIKVNPPPFCVLDEIEAALDDVNVERFAKYLRRVCDKTQFLVITHRRGTMEEADVLYGVTMEDEGVSKLLELKVKELLSV